MVTLLRAQGVRVKALLNPWSDRKASAQAFFVAQGEPYRWVPKFALPGIGRPGDILIAPILPKGHITRIRRAGLRMIQVQEGARAAMAPRTHPAVPFLGWGPACATARAKVQEVVGCAILEKIAAQGRAPRAGYVLINAKFAGKTTAEVGQAWLKGALWACAQAALPVCVSAHPNAFKAGPLPVEVSTRPVEDLVRAADLLISPPSTVVYMALVCDVPVIVAPVAREPLAEFARPLGAFPIVHDWEDAVPRIARLALGKVRRDPKPFLASALSMLPDQTAEDRMAAVVMGLHAAPYGRWLKPWAFRILDRARILKRHSELAYGRWRQRKT